MAAAASAVAAVGCHQGEEESHSCWAFRSHCWSSTACHVSLLSAAYPRRVGSDQRENLGLAPPPFRGLRCVLKVREA